MSDYNTTIGVQIYDDFAKLQSELPKLISNLERIKTSLGDISNIKISSQGLSNISKQLSKIVNIDSLSNDLNKLNSTLDKLNISNLKSMREEIARLKQEYSNYINTMNRVTGNKIKTSNTANTVKNSNYLSEGLNDIKGTRNQNITSYIRQMNNGLSDVDKTAQKTKKSINSMFSLGKIYWFLSYTKQAFRGLGNVITNAMDFTETENYFSRAMGNMYDKAMLFQNKLTDMYGMSMNTMMNAQATYKNMIGSLGGLSDQMAYDLSETVTKMTLDFSSLYNVDFDKTVAKMQSALSKQVRPIRSVSGYDITQNVLGATAQDLGISRSISEMNELEKRLLIVLTLANQMRNSGAMNDFARTIEQPSNQLRILQEQLIEVGRWIGSVFYGIIGSVLPYINGFVMAIKELIKTFALFVGYKIPDSSGETQTILDSLDASTDDINTGLGEVGKNTDKNIKKAKEWKNVLMGFDVANVLPDQSSESLGTGSSSGLGGMTVDPKILEALKNYEYLFDNVHMTAQDIRDVLLDWAKIAKKSFKNNIFQPIKNSWNKYGPSTKKNFSNAFKNMKSIAGNVFKIADKKWPSFFQSASDLFFSLLDTASIVISSITSFFKTVMDNGGNVFLEGLFDLATAVIDLATAINDDFIKPTIKLFNKTFVPVISKAIGSVLKIIGSLMTDLSKFIKKVSKSETIVKTLATAFTVLWGVIKLGKLSQLWTSFSKGTGIVSKIVTLFVENTTVGNKLWGMYVKAGNKFGTLKDAWKAGLGVISSLFTKLKNQVTLTKSYQAGMGYATTSTKGFTLAQKLCSKAMVALKKALNFLADHPLVAVALAIGTAAIALGAFKSANEDATLSIEDCSDEIQEEYNEVKDLSDALKEAKKSAEDHVAETEAQIKVAQNYIKKLQDMEDEDGYVKNIESAKLMVDEINEVLPDTVSLTEEGRLEWKKTPNEIEKSIKSLKKLAKQQAYQEVYVEAIKTQITQEQTLNKQIKKKNALVDEEKKRYELYLESVKNNRDQRTMTFEEYISENKAINEQNALIEATQKELDETTETVEDYGNEINNLCNELDDTSDSTEDLIKQTKKFSESTKTAYNNIGKTGQKQITSIIDDLKDYDKKMNDSAKSGKKLSKEEIKTLKNLRSQKVKQYGQLVRDYDLTYDNIIEIAETSGVSLTEEEKGTIKAIVEAYKNGGIDGGDEFVANLTDSMNDGKKDVSKSASELADSATDSLKKNPISFSTAIRSVIGKANEKVSETSKGILNNPIKFQSSVASAYKPASNRIKELKGLAQKGVTFSSYVTSMVKDAQKKRKEAQEKAGSVNIIATVTGDMYKAGENAGNNYKQGFASKATTTITSVISGVQNAIGSLKFFASGGFPDVGQMFIARENGIPELVGTMGRRNAVANNAQIENGIYNAVLSAIRDAGGFVQRGNNGDIHIVIKDENGRTRIEKIIRDYNKYIQSNGGKGGFII